MKDDDDDDEKVVRFPVRLRRFRLPKQNEVKARRWIIRGLALRKTITAIIGSTGAGKSTFALTIVAYASAGRSFDRFPINRRLKVALLSAEDDEEELDRRLVAIADAHDISRDDLFNVFIVDTADGVCLARPDKYGHMVPTKTLLEIERLVAAQNIDLVILDPLVELWEGEENSNNQMHAATALIRNTLRRIDAGCILTHHVKKGTVTPGDIDAGRGASSFGGLVRLGFTLTTATPEMAQAFGLEPEEARKLVRLDKAKGNYVPGDSEPVWMRWKNITLDNADDSEDEIGDDVGVLVQWKPGGLFDRVSLTAIGEVLDAIDMGITDDDGNPTGQRYTTSRISKERCVIYLFLEHIDGWNEEQAKKGLELWLKSGLLYERKYKLGRAKAVKGLYVDQSKRPDRQ